MKWYFGLHSASKGKSLKAMSRGGKGISRVGFRKIILVATCKLNWN